MLKKGITPIKLTIVYRIIVTALIEKLVDNCSTLKKKKKKKWSNVPYATHYAVKGRKFVAFTDVV